MARKPKSVSNLPQNDNVTMGGEDQAVSYAAEHLNYWRQTPGAVKWLTEQSR
jgi:hypothetical protein